MCTKLDVPGEMGRKRIVFCVRVSRELRAEWFILFFAADYSSEDCKRRIAAIQREAAPEMERLIELVQEVERFCRNNVDCRRFQLLGRFEEAFNPEDCAASCDNCTVNGHSLFSSQHGSSLIKEETSDCNDDNDDDDTRTLLNPSMTPPSSSINLDDLQGRCYAELVVLDRMVSLIAQTCHQSAAYLSLFIDT